jgi:TfoX/Sxy family transcriptional regulator of competence genes
MAYNEVTADRIRLALAHLTDVQEKKMFGGLAFMVNGKMCVTAGKDRIMCRIDPAMHENAIKEKGVQTVKMGERVYRGYVHVSDKAIKTDQAFNRWIAMALDFNKISSPAKRQKR